MMGLMECLYTEEAHDAPFLQQRIILFQVNLLKTDGIMAKHIERC